MRCSRPTALEVSKIVSAPTVYLAGGMEKSGDQGRVWRDEIIPHLSDLGYKVWNPYSETQRSGVSVEELLALKESDFEAFRQEIGKIIDHDLNELSKCEMLVCRLDKAVLNGSGTLSELTFCRCKGIPSYVWIDLPNGKNDVPMWAMGCITAYTEDKDEFYKLIPAAEKLADG